MNLIISPAHAQALPGAGFDFMSLLPLVLIFGVFYLFLIRPQQKKAQQQKNVLSALRRGDKIITGGGMIGVITKVVNDQELQVEIAEGVRVRVLRAMVVDLLSKTEPASEIAEETPSPTAKKHAAQPSSKKSASAKKKTSK